MKTYAAKASEIERKWVVIDVDGRPLGRVASEIATILKGKNKPMYSTHLDVGDYVIVINAEKVRMTGKKADQKMYYRHTQYPGGLRSVGFQELIAKHPDRVMEHAVKGMLPHNTLGRAMLRKLKVYAGPTHPHEAQVKGQEKE